MNLNDLCTCLKNTDERPVWKGWKEEQNREMKGIEVIKSGKIIRIHAKV